MILMDCILHIAHYILITFVVEEEDDVDIPSCVGSAIPEIDSSPGIILAAVSDVTRSIVPTSLPRSVCYSTDIPAFKNNRILSDRITLLRNDRHENPELTFHERFGFDLPYQVKLGKADIFEYISNF